MRHIHVAYGRESGIVLESTEGLQNANASRKWRPLVQKKRLLVFLPLLYCVSAVTRGTNNLIDNSVSQEKLRHHNA